jgi:hypothetical protein
MQQSAPGRYVGEFAADRAGSYFLTLLPGGEHAPVRTGVNVPYSSEFRDRETNLDLLERLAGREPVGGAPGVLIRGPVEPNKTDPLLEVNAFRRDLARAVSSRDVWPLLIFLGSCVFFADVFVRRVSVGSDWIKPLWDRVAARVLRRDLPPVVDERLERLRQRKQQIEGSLDERRAGARFDPVPDEPVDTSVLESETAASRPATQPGKAKRSLGPAQAEPEDYTSRLLRAKRQALKGKPGDDAGTGKNP